MSIYNVFHGYLYEKCRLLGEVDKEAVRPIWEVKKRWVTQVRTKILIYKKPFEIFALMGSNLRDPPFLNLPDRTDGFLIHFAK
jgi:hypothetical protein